MKTRGRKTGKTATRLQRVQHAIGLSNRQMAQLLQTSPRTIAGCVQSGQTPFRGDQKRRLVKLDLIAVMAAKVYSRAGTRAFFAAPLAKFGDKSATDLLLEGQFKCVARMIASDYEERGDVLS
jgi:hypothetical protein